MGSIGALMQEAIENYAQLNKKFHENIILYRDGVGESQFKDVLDIEVKSIQETFGALKKKFKMEKYDPKFMEIIVQKEIHHRFFQASGGKLFNPASGTVVCSEVVSTKYWDFYLTA